jgi:hypothetical protein
MLRALPRRCQGLSYFAPSRGLNRAESPRGRDLFPRPATFRDASGTATRKPASSLPLTPHPSPLTPASFPPITPGDETCGGPL